MGEFQGVTIVKKQEGLNRRTANKDGVMAIVCVSAVLPAGIVANSAIETIQAIDAETKGFDAAFDANNKVLTKHHVDRFYRYAPDGTLYLVPTSFTTAKAFFESDAAKGLFRTIEDIKRIGFVYNDDVVGLVLDDEINACQTFINELNADNIKIDGIYLEARNIGKTAVDKRTLNAPNVSLVAFQDPLTAVIDAKYNKYGAVGAVLGSRAVRKVNESLGSTNIINKPDYAKGFATFSLTDAAKKIFTSVALSDGTLVSTLTQVEKNTLTDRGYIYGGTYRGLAGVYLNAEPTCVNIASDFAFGNNNGVWNKAARGIRQALLPKVKSILKRDASTGKLASTTVSTLELIAEKPIIQMVADDEISGGDVYINADQNPSDQVPLKIKGSIRKDGIVFNFEFELGLN